MIRLKEGYTLASAQMADAEGWMALVELVGDNFPGLVMADYRETLAKNIRRGSALCVKHQERVVGVLLFSLKQKTLSCMAVHPDHRQKGIATAMVETMIEEFPKDSEIWVSTFRQEDSKGKAPRALYKKLGFQEDALVMEFGYPNQKFVLRKA